MALTVGTPGLFTTTGSKSIAVPTVGASGSTVVVMSLTPKSASISSLLAGWSLVRQDHPSGNAAQIIFYKNGSNSSNLTFTLSGSGVKAIYGQIANSTEQLQGAPTQATFNYGTYASVTSSSKTPTKSTSTYSACYSYTQFPRKSVSPDMVEELQTEEGGADFYVDVTLYSKALTGTSASGTQRIWPYDFYDASPPGAASAGGDEQHIVGTWLWEQTAAALAADTAGVASVTADLSTAKPLAAAPTGVAAVTANLSTAKPLAAATAGVAAVTADLSTAKPLVASLTAVATIVADTAPPIVLATDLVALAVVSANLTAPGAPAVASASPPGPTGHRIQVVRRVGRATPERARPARVASEPVASPEPAPVVSPLAALAAGQPPPLAPFPMLDPAMAAQQQVGVQAAARQQAIAQANAQADAMAQRALAEHQRALAARIAAFRLPAPKPTTQRTVQQALATLRQHRTPKPPGRVVHEYNSAGQIVVSKLDRGVDENAR